MLKTFCLLLLFAAANLPAATLTVTSLSDSGPGTLRNALGLAQSGDTILIAAEGRIALSSGPLQILRSLHINGPGPHRLLVDGQNVTVPFVITNNATVFVSGIAITNGSNLGYPMAQGGGLHSLGNLSLSNCVISDCEAEFGTGGIWSAGDLALANCVVTNCGMYYGHGGITCSGKLDLVNCAVTRCFGYPGGGIIAYGPTTLRRCTISNNLKELADGGGIAVHGAPLVLDSTTVCNNIATGDMYNAVSGGGIQVSEGSLLMTNCTVSGNASQSPYGGVGGGICTYKCSVQFESCTVVSNIAYNHFEENPSKDVGGGIYLWISPGFPRVFQSRNTIFAGNSSVVPTGWITVPSDCSGTMLSLGFNMVQSLSGLTLSGDLTGCIFETDPRLGALRNNGGPTPTHALLPSSPAIDKGNSSSAFDQRGFLRPCDLAQFPNAADGSDIGAFELRHEFIAIEAEHSLMTVPMAPSSDSSACNGQYISSPINNNGTATYNLSIPVSGDYVIWCRINAVNFNSDSFFVSMDGGPELIYDAAENIQTNAWQWTRVIGRAEGDPVVHLEPRVFPLSAGSHTLVFRCRDANTRLDRLIITSDTAFVPPINFEAESATLVAPMASISDTNASHGQYIASTVPDSGRASFSFPIPATNTYYVWCRVLATNANADSFYVSMDNGPELIYDTAEGIWTNLWQWTRLNGRTNGGPVDLTPRTFNLSQGMHTLVFRSREANSKLDRVLITSDPAFNPAADFDQTSTNQTVTGYANSDSVIWLGETAPWRDTVSFVITTLPLKGTLYQYAGGTRGLTISPGTLVTDPFGRVIFAPIPNSCGLSYSSCQVICCDRIHDTTEMTVRFNVLAPPVQISNWTTAAPNVFRFRFSGIPQTSYHVIVSSNVLSSAWTQLGLAAETSRGIYEFSTPVPTNSPNHLFQVTWP